jgi:hypothetical protein
MLKHLTVATLALGFSATASLACSGLKPNETAQTPIPPVAQAPQTPIQSEPVKQDVAAVVVAPEATTPKTN